MIDVLKIFWKRGEIAHDEQFLLLSTIFCNLLLDFLVKTGTRLSPRDKRIFEITEFEITRIDCISKCNAKKYNCTKATVSSALYGRKVSVVNNAELD